MKCVLAFNTYAINAATREYLLSSGLRSSASCTKAHFPPEVSLLHENAADIPGASSCIYNPNTQEVFAFHHDNSRGSGRKYHLCFGLQSSMNQPTTREDCSLYKTHEDMLQCCDEFNCHYRDRTWPHERGGHGVGGQSSRIHDFHLASILQNTFNLFFELDPGQGSDVDFFENCVSLADELFTHACSL